MDKKRLEKEAEKRIFFSGKNYIDRLNSLLEDNKYLVFFSFILIIVLFILIIGYFNLSKKITISVEIPPKLYRTGTLYIGSQKANKLFYDVWGRYVVSEIANYSPYNIKEKIKKVSFMFDPQKLVKVKVQFIKLENEVINNLVTHTFIPTKTYVDDNGNFVQEGIGKSVLGDNLSVIYEKCKYKVKFKIEDYHLFIENMNINCTPIDKEDYLNIYKEIKQKEEYQKKVKINELKKQKGEK